MCAFLVYTAQAPGYSAWELSKAGPWLCAVPRTKPRKFRFSGTPQRHRLGWACVLCLPRSEQLRRPGVWQAHSPSWAVRLITSLVPAPGFPECNHESAVSGVLCVSSRVLISGCKAPDGCQPSRIPGRLVSNWEPACSLVGDAVSGAVFAPFLLALAVACLPPCLQHWMGQSTAG